MGVQPAKRPTQQDIADGLGISVITVQRALRSSGYVSQEMRDRIQREAERVGYRPHRGAQSLVRGVAHKLAVFSTESPSFYWDSVEQGVRTAAAQIDDFGYETAYHRVRIGDTEGYLDALREAINDGLEAAAVVNNLEYKMERVFELLDDYELPYITLNIDAPTSRRRTFVGVDHRAEGRLAGNFLATWARAGSTALQVAGPSRVATSLQGADIAAERFAGFREVLQERHIEARRIVVDDNASQERAEHAISEIGQSIAGIYLTSVDSTLATTLRAVTSTPIVAGTVSPALLDMLRTTVVDALIYQNPILQGYYAVKTLEHLVDNADPAPAPTRLVHSLVMKENIDLPSNHHLMVASRADAEGHS